MLKKSALAKDGDTVKINYTVKLEDGKVLATTNNKVHLQFTIGEFEDIVGLENIKNYLENFFNAFPDLNITVDETIAVGNKLVQRWTLTGTNTGYMADMPPTGKNVGVSGVSIIHMVNGKAVEIWDFYNALDMYQQLGFTLIPPQEQSEQ